MFCLTGCSIISQPINNVSNDPYKKPTKDEMITNISVELQNSGQFDPLDEATSTYMEIDTADYDRISYNYYTSSGEWNFKIPNAKIKPAGANFYVTGEAIARGDTNLIGDYQQINFTYLKAPVAGVIIGE